MFTAALVKSRDVGTICAFGYINTLHKGKQMCFKFITKWLIPLLTTVCVERPSKILLVRVYWQYLGVIVFMTVWTDGTGLRACLWHTHSTMGYPCQCVYCVVLVCLGAVTTLSRLAWHIHSLPSNISIGHALTNGEGRGWSDGHHGVIYFHTRSLFYFQNWN